MATAAKKKKLRSQELADEIVVGGRTWFAGTATTAQRNDSRDADDPRLDQRAIRRLRLDAEVESDVSMLADSVFSDGVEIVAAVVDEDDADYEQAKDIADFVKLAVSDTRRPLHSVCKEMFKAAFYNGVKVAEIVLRYQNDSRVDGKLVLDRINPKPASATAFVTDKFLNVLGLVGAKRPGSIVPAGGSVSLSPDEIIPRDKFLVFAFELDDNDPRGLSQVRAAYDEYCDKQLTKQQWKEWRRTSAIPKKVGITGDGAKSIQLKEPDGRPKLDERGEPVVISAQQALMLGLEGFANNSAITVPFGFDVKQLEVTGTGEQFERAIKYNDSKIRKVVLGDSLVTSEADKDARAARESSKDVSDIRKQALRTVIADAVEKDLFRLLTVVNFGADKAHLTPKCFLGDTEATDWATDLNAASGAGYSFAPEHFAQLDAQFGLEPREIVPQQTNPGGEPAQAGQTVPDERQDNSEETE